MHFGSIILKPAENKLPLLKYCINTLCNYQQTFNIFFSNNTMSIQNLSKPTWCNYQPSFLKILKPNFRRVFAYWPNNVITCYSGGKKAWISQLYMRLYGLMPRMTWWHTTVICVDHILVRSIVHGQLNVFQVCTFKLNQESFLPNDFFLLSIDPTNCLRQLICQQSKKKLPMESSWNWFFFFKMSCSNIFYTLHLRSLFCVKSYPTLLRNETEFNI